MSATNSFLLIDGALANHGADGMIQIDQECPSWLVPLYPNEAANAGPMVIDIEAALAAGETAQMMELANAIWPQLHLSVIDTALSFAETCDHLRQFMSIRTEAHQTFSLRFADCAAMTMLMPILTQEQWSVMTRPFLIWRVHMREGLLQALPAADITADPSPIPLMFSQRQLEELNEAVAPDVMIAHIRDIRHGEELPGSASEQHRWATEALAVWRAHGSAHDNARRWIIAAALDTRGQILRLETLPLIMSLPNQVDVRAAILQEVAQCNSKRPAFWNPEISVRAA